MTERKKIIRFNLPGKNEMGPPAMIDRWYDRHTRSWVVQTKDRAGHQIGNAAYFGLRKEATAEEMERRATHGLGPRRSHGVPLHQVDRRGRG